MQQLMETELVTKKVNCGAVGFLVGATSSAANGISTAVFRFKRRKRRAPSRLGPHVSDFPFGFGF